MRTAQLWWLFLGGGEKTITGGAQIATRRIAPRRAPRENCYRSASLGAHGSNGIALALRGSMLTGTATVPVHLLTRRTGCPA